MDARLRIRATLARGFLIALCGSLVGIGLACATKRKLHNDDDPTYLCL